MLREIYHVWTEPDNHRFMLGGLFKCNVNYVASSISKLINHPRFMKGRMMLNESVNVIEHESV